MLKIIKHILLFRRALLCIFCSLSLYSTVDAQLTFTLSSNPLLVNGRLSIDGVILQIQNNSAFNGNVVIQIYSDRFQKNTIAKSKSLIVHDLSHTYNLQEVFSSVDFEWINDQSTTVCFNITAEKQNIPLGFNCSEITNIRKKKNNSISQDKNKQDFFDANITYELETFPQSNTPVNHVLDYKGEVRIKEFPIRFQGFFQRNKDPYLDYDLSHFTSFLDVNQWRQIVKNKVDKVYQKERDSLLVGFPDYRSLVSRKKYVENVMNDPGALKDLAAIDSLNTLMKNLNIASTENLLAYQDSLNQSLTSKKEALEQKFKTNIDEEQKDSLNQKLIALQKQIEKSKNLYTLANKKEAYNKLMKVREESDQYLQKADSITAALDEEYQKTLNQPNKLNHYLRQHNLGNKYMFLLNHVSEFRFGNVNPGYSRLVLQNSQIKGLSLGLEYGRWGLAGFRGKLRNSDLNLAPDSLSIEAIVFGTKISYAKTEKLINNFFLVSSNQSRYFGDKINQSIIGHTSTLQLDKRNTLDFEIAWAIDDSGLSSELEETRWEKTIKSLAGISNYTGATKNSKLSWNTEIEYYGPEYFDFNNPFLANNRIELSNNIRYSILSGLHIGLSALFNKGNLWKTENPIIKRTFSQGANVSYFHEKWPAIQYVLNNSKIEGANYTLHSFFQNLNISKSYALKNTQLQSLFNTSLLNNNSPLDSLDSKLITMYASQEVRLTEHVRITAAFNYFNLYKLQDGRRLDLSYEIRMPLNFDRLNIEPGLKWISNSTFEKLGWDVNVSWLATKKLSLNIFTNSLWLNGTIDEFGLIKNEYTSHISGRINYRF